MATISGKRFQITDGASSPTNLFPYTVTEAVYGLSTVLANTQSAAVTAAATSAASLYLPLTGGTLTGTTGSPLTINTSAIYNYIYFQTGGNNRASVGYYPSDGLVLANSIGNYLELRNDGTIKYNNGAGSGDKDVYWAGNSNKSDVAWACSALTTNGYVTFYESSQHTYRINLNFDGAVARIYACNDAATDMCDLKIGSVSGGNSIYYKGSTGNVGIGTTSLACRFNVSNGSTSGWTSYFQNNASNIHFSHSDGSGIVVESTGTTASVDLLALYYGESTIGTAGICALKVNALGNVGIGTASPAYKLDVNGSAYATSLTASILYAGRLMTCGSSSNAGFWRGSLFSSGLGAGSIAIASDSANDPIVFLRGNVGIGTVSPGAKLDVAGTSSSVVSVPSAGDGLMIHTKGNTATNYALYCSVAETTLGTVATPALVVRSTGNVGIGTGSPEYKLDVVGDFCVNRTNHDTNNTTFRIACGDRNVTLYAADPGDNYVDIIFNLGGTERMRLSNWGVLTTSGDQVISSDAAKKKNWREVGYGIEEIASCTVGRFDWKDGHGTSVGSKAQDWLPLVPELVHGEEGNMTLAYGQIALVNTIIEAREIEVLKKRVAELEDEVKRLRS